MSRQYVGVEKHEHPRVPALGCSLYRGLPDVFIGGHE
jgi:hypothetical protein